MANKWQTDFSFLLTKCLCVDWFRWLRLWPNNTFFPFVQYLSIYWTDKYKDASDSWCIIDYYMVEPFWSIIVHLYRNEWIRMDTHTHKHTDNSSHLKVNRIYIYGWHTDTVTLNRPESCETNLRFSDLSRMAHRRFT